MRQTEALAAARRPIAARGTPWARAMADRLARWRVAPNAISLASVGVAAAGAALIVAAPGPAGWLGAAACVQARLLCNMLDGMVAIEGGRATAIGPLFNELPDRAADTLLLVAAGYAAGIPALGWAAALVALATANIRLLGGALGARQDFSGLMSKPRRMAALTAGLLAACVLPPAPVLVGTLGGILAGSLLTCAGRARRLALSLGQ